MKKTCIYFIVGLLLNGGVQAAAALGRVTGGEPGIWNPGRDSLIVARVREIAKAKGENVATHMLTLEPLVTLAGSFDPSENASLEVRVFVGQIDSSVVELPTVGVLVLAAIETVQSDRALGPTVFIELSLCGFMPDPLGRPLLQIDGMNDKRVLQALANVRQARNEGRERERREKEEWEREQRDRAASKKPE